MLVVCQTLPSGNVQEKPKMNVQSTCARVPIQKYVENACFLKQNWSLRLAEQLDARSSFQTLLVREKLWNNVLLIRATKKEHLSAQIAGYPSDTTVRQRQDAHKTLQTQHVWEKM